jgi:hypothetical protein
VRPALLLLCPLLAAACARETPARREQALLDGAPAELRARIDESVVPVLLPRGVNLDRATLVTERTYTALSVPAAGYTVSLHSVTIFHDHPGVAAAGAARPMRGTTGHVTVNESIRTASWIEGGVAHALDLECADPADPRCADDTLLLSLVEGLSVVGGGGTPR